MSTTTVSLDWLIVADAVLKATILFAAAAAVSFMLRRAPAALRHLVWTLALAGALAVPLLSLTLPKWHLPLVSVASPGAAPADLEPGSAEAPPTATRLSRAATRAEAAEPAPAPPSGTTVQAPSLLGRTASALNAITWQRALGVIWFSGVVIVCGRLLIGLAAVQWLTRRSEVIADAPWLPLARAVASGLGIPSCVRFLRSRDASMPVAAGIIRPSVIMPADADEWSKDRLRIVLLHELAHVKRRDCLTHLLAQAACALYWFNPLAWMAAGRARAERERACDDLVLASGTRGPDYADELLEMARAMGAGRFGGLLTGASLAMAHRSQLEGRLIAILDPALPRSGVSRARRVAAAAIFCGAVAPLGAVQPWVMVDPGRTDRSTPEAVASGTRTVSTPHVRASSAEREQGGAPKAPPTRVPVPDVSRAVPVAPPPPGVEVVAAPIPELTVHAVLDSVGSEIANGVEVTIEHATQDPKPQPKPKPQAGGGRQVDPRLVAALTEALKDSDKQVRESALHALVRLRDPAAFEPLVQALKDPAADVRKEAVHGLSQLRDRRAVDPLMTMLKDESADVREQAVFGLGQLRDRAAVPGLIAALKDSSTDVRKQAAFALSQLRDPSAVEALGLAVRDENAEVREQAVFALSQIRDRRAVGSLIGGLKDPSADVRSQAAFALGQLRDPAAVDGLVLAIKDADVDVRKQVVFALGQIRDPRAIDALTTALKDQSAQVRQQAAFALGQLIR